MRSYISSSLTSNSDSSNSSRENDFEPQDHRIKKSKSKRNMREMKVPSSSSNHKNKVKRQSSKLSKKEQVTNERRISHLQRCLCAGVFMVIFVLAAVFAILQLRVKAKVVDSDTEAGMGSPTMAPPVIANCTAQNSTNTEPTVDKSLPSYLIFVETNVVMPKSESVVETISSMSTVMGSLLQNLIAKGIAENGCIQSQGTSSTRNRDNGIRSINVIPSNHSETGGCVLDDDKSCHEIDFTVEVFLDEFLYVNKYLLVQNLDRTVDGNVIYTELIDMNLNVDMVQIRSVTSTEPTRPPTEPPTSIHEIPLMTKSPTPMPSDPPSGAPSETVITYVPGKLTVRSNDLLLSEGLACRILARTGQPVSLTGLEAADGTIPVSRDPFHIEPDGAGVFEIVSGPTDDNNGNQQHLVEGGWVYVSNSENEKSGEGGVGGIYFNAQGEVVEYRRLLEGTTDNCSGGKTPWGSWVSCEEKDGGKVYQVDPMGVRPPQVVSAIDDGYYEAFAYDIRNVTQPRFFVTEDHPEGALRRFTPTNASWEDPWTMLHGDGTLDYLLLEPHSTSHPNLGGTFRWTSNLKRAQSNAKSYYQYTEGIDVYDGELFVVSKLQKELFILDLDAQTYKVFSTVSGIFDGTPDQLKRVVHGNGDGPSKTLLYFCEEDGTENGVHARDENGWFFTILESDLTLDDEATGLAFSPDGKHMYLSYQKTGRIYDIWRDDGLPFHAQTLNVRYHSFSPDAAG